MVNPGTQEHRTQPRSIQAPQRRQPANRLKLAPNRATAASITLRLLMRRTDQRRRQNQGLRNTANPGTHPLQTHRTRPISIRAPQRPPTLATATRNTLRSQTLRRRQPAKQVKLAPNRAMMAAMAPMIITLRLLKPRKHQQRRQKQAARNTANPGTHPLQTHRTQLRPIRASQRPPAQATATRSTFRSRDLQREQPRNRLKLAPRR